jgi:hypothetical protein
MFHETGRSDIQLEAWLEVGELMQCHQVEELKYLRHAMSWERVREAQQGECKIVGRWGHRYIRLYFQ